jgi:hypothetical protein
MLFRKRKRRAGVGLGTILIVFGGLYASGAGAILLERMQALPNMCRAQLSGASPMINQTLCGGGEKIIAGITHVSGWVGNELDGVFANLFGKRTFSTQNTGVSSIDLQQFNAQIDMQRLASMMSSEATLNQILRAGPQGVASGNGASYQLQQALDSYAIAQRYLQQHSTPAQSATALQWLQHGAAQHEYGLLPQLSLGGVYLQGGAGIQADPERAQLYYGQALTSLRYLQSDPSIESRNMLAALPVAPAELQRQLIAVIRQIKPSSR